MIFAIFTIIIFISQLIICFALIIGFLKLDRKIKNTNIFLNEAKPKIKDISTLARGISEQFAELTPIWVESFLRFRNKILLNRLESLISLFMFWGINKKVMKVVKKSKFLKAIVKGLSFVNNMV